MIFRKAAHIPHRTRFVVILWILAIPLSAQSERFELGNLSFSLSPKVLKDGSITDVSFGYQYTPNSAGMLRLRFSNTSKNEQFDETVPDSLNAAESSAFEVFLTPFEYAFINKGGVQLKVGGGLYYEYYTLAERGFFDMPILEALGKERVNSFSNNLTRHNIGPNIALGFSYQGERLNLTVNAGAVPIFYLNARQETMIAPLMDPHSADYSQDTSGSPYLYADITVTLFKYVSLAFLYDYSELDYKVIDFDDQFKWRTPESKIASQSLKLEVSALLPLGGVYTQIGYGHTFDSTRVNSAPLVEGGKDYLILAMRSIH
jgi:hypothetical protein